MADDASTETKRSRARTRQSGFLSTAAIYVVANVANAAIPFALLPVLTRFLAPAEYGQVAMFQTFLGAMGAIVGLSVAGAASRKYYDVGASQESLREFMAACFQLLLLSACVVLVGVTVASNWLSGALGVRPLWLQCAVITSAFMMVVQLRLTQWQVRGAAIKFGSFQIVFTTLNMLLSTFLVVVLSRGAEGRIEGQVVSTAVAGLFAVFLLRRDQLLAFCVWRPAYLKEAISFGAPLVPHIAGIFLVSSVDRLVIKAELGISSAGIYMVAVQLASALAIGFDAINNAYVPWLFERLKRSSAADNLRIVRYTYAWFGCILLAVAVVFLIGPWVVVAVAGRHYTEASKVLGWIALGHGFNGMYLMVTNYVFYSKRTGLLSIATISAGLLNIMLLVALTPLLGLPGAAMAFAAAMACRFIFTWWVAQRRHPMPWLLQPTHAQPGPTPV